MSNVFEIRDPDTGAVIERVERKDMPPAARGDAPDFVEVGEAGIAMDDAMRRKRRVQLVG